MRDRRRAETVREIKEAALDQLAESGADGLSLRAVARTVGMTVQSLYHYFGSRDALLSALVTDAHHAVADAVQAAADDSRGRPPLVRLLAATGAYRDWAYAHPAAFMLIYGTPVPGFEPLPGSDSGVAAVRLAAPFADVVFDGWTPAQLAALPLLAGEEELEQELFPDLPTLPAGALAYFFELRGRMHGLVVLELAGHMPTRPGGALFRNAMHRMAAEIAGLRNHPR